MKTTLVHWFRIALAFSFLITVVGRRQDPLEKPIQAMTIYLPLVSNHSIQGMVFIPTGEFQMGCSIHEYCFPYETPPHKVFLDMYYIDKYQVTNAQYAQCAASGACTQPGAYGSHTRASYYNNAAYADYPVIHIAWDNAQDFCRWAGKRLPTEAEWEKAAQGGLDVTKNLYPWGDQSPVCTLGAPNGAQYDDCTPDDTVRVGSFGPNGYGLYDMAGNVWEWVGDWWNNFYYSFSPYSNPTGPASGSDKVIRGGSWNYNWNGLRWAHRNYSNPNNPLGNHDIGFRCVFSPMP